jgi:hypothetical protein
MRLAGVPISEPGPRTCRRGPYGTYAEEWQGWGDFLGTGAIAWRGRAWRPFTEARAFARSLGLANKDMWIAFAKGELPEKGKLPTDVPANPVRVYKEQGWRGTSDWLGLDRRRGPYLPFEEARAFARGLGLGSVEEWRDYAAGKLLPEDMPRSPHKSYADKWQGWKDWLGKPDVRWRPFEEARAFARGLGLRTTAEWRAFCLLEGKLPHDVPGKPERVYDGTGWEGIRDWLGTA